MAGAHRSSDTPKSNTSPSHISAAQITGQSPSLPDSDDEHTAYSSVRVKKRLRSVSSSAHAFALEPSPIAKPTRQRIAVACSNCRRRKIKCYGFDPNIRDSRCANCVRMNYDCLFAPVSSAAATIRPIPSVSQPTSVHGYQPESHHVDYDYQLNRSMSLYESSSQTAPNRPLTVSSLSAPTYPSFPLVPPYRPVAESSRQNVQLPPIRSMIFPQMQVNLSSHPMTSQHMSPHRQAEPNISLPGLASTLQTEHPTSKRTKNLDVKDLVND